MRSHTHLLAMRNGSATCWMALINFEKENNDQNTKQICLQRARTEEWQSGNTDHAGLKLLR
jgi:hypothetical protein